MSTLKYSHEQLVQLAKLTPADMAEIDQLRQPHNRLGFAYQLAYVRLFNRFPAQVTFVTIDDLLNFVSVQLNITTETIADYATRQKTISELNPFFKPVRFFARGCSLGSAYREKPGPHRQQDCRKPDLTGRSAFLTFQHNLFRPDRNRDSLSVPDYAIPQPIGSA